MLEQIWRFKFFMLFLEMNSETIWNFEFFTRRSFLSKTIVGRFGFSLDRERKIFILPRSNPSKMLFQKS